jgi:hypothetical protein
MTDSPMYVNQTIEDEEDTCQCDEENQNPSNIHETKADSNSNFSKEITALTTQLQEFQKNQG